MKNAFKPYIKALDKADSIHVSRFNDDAYVGSPQMVIKMHEIAYDLFFRTEKPYYIPMQPGEGFSRYRGIKTDAGQPEPSENPVRYDKIMSAEPERAAMPTPIRIDASGYAEGLRVIQGHDFIVTVNEKWYNAIIQAMQSTPLIKCDGMFKPITLTDGTITALLLPVKTGPEHAQLLSNLHRALFA